MAALRLSLLVLFLHMRMQHGKAEPNYCLLSSGIYTCDYASMQPADRPIDFTQFSVQPQVLHAAVNGFMPYMGDTRTFSETFSGINKATFDPNFAATLNIDCGWAGQLYLRNGAFYNMSYVQNLKIQNCLTYHIPANAFEDFNDLDFFGFEGGLIDDVNANAMVGLNVEKLVTDTHTIPRNLGHFEILYSTFTSGSLPPGLMYNWKNLTSATLRGAGLGSLTADVFKYNVKLRYIDISDNTFTSIPTGLFSGLNSLSDVQLYDIDWVCSCDNLWFIGYARDNNITLFGDLMCGNQQGTTARKYYYDNCDVVDVCYGQTGFASGKRCQTVLSTLALTASILALLVSMIGLGQAISNMRNIPEPTDEKDDLKAQLKRSRELRYLWKKSAKKIINAFRFRKQTESPDDYLADDDIGQYSYQEMSDYDQGSSGYDPGGSGFNPGGSGFNPGGSGYDPGRSGYTPGGAGYNPGGSGYDTGRSGYNQEMSEFNHPRPDYSQGIPDFNQGMPNHNQPRPN